MQVLVAYNSNDVDRFIEVADFLEEHFPAIAVEGATDATITVGAFEIRGEDGNLLYSHSAGTEGLPEAAALERALGGVKAPERSGATAAGCM